MHSLLQVLTVFLTLGQYAVSRAAAIEERSRRYERHLVATANSE
jgi:hypothetical protein